MLQADGRDLMCCPAGCKWNFISGSGEVFCTRTGAPVSCCSLSWVDLCKPEVWYVLAVLMHIYSLQTLPEQPWCSLEQQSVMERQLACSHGRLLIICFSGQQMLDLAGESQTEIPMQFSAFLCLKLDLLGEKFRFQRVCWCLQWCLEEMSDHNSHIQSRQSKSTNKLCYCAKEAPPQSAECGQGGQHCCLRVWDLLQVSKQHWWMIVLWIKNT